jgi:hypothetical protein
MAAYRTGGRSISPPDQDYMRDLIRQELRALVAESYRAMLEVLGQTTFRPMVRPRAARRAEIDAASTAPDGATWIEIKDAAALFGMTLPSMHNAIQRGTFPVHTYKLGKKRVIDRDVLAEFFENKRAEGLSQLDGRRPIAGRERDKR